MTDTRLKKNGRGRPAGFVKNPTEYENRFEKFYYENRKRLSIERKNKYKERKAAGLCIRCENKAVEGRVFCWNHMLESRTTQKKRRP